MACLCPNCRASLPGPPIPASCPRCGRATALGFAPTQAAFSASLIVRSPEAPPSEIALGERLTIGRHPDNQLRLEDREISKEHAEIRQVGAEWWLQDLKSSNGTFVNGRPVTRLKLHDGDAIAMGATVLTFRLAGAGGRRPSSVTMVQAPLAGQVLASVRAEDPAVARQGFRPEREIADVEALRRDYEKLRIAHEFHRQVGLERDLGALYEKILQVAFDLLRADNGVVLLFHPDAGRLEPEVVRRRQGGELMLSQTLLDHVVRTREGVLSQDAVLDARFSGAASILTQGIRSAMAVPLLTQGELRGLLYLDTREVAGAFTEKDLRLLSGIAAQAAVALENSELARRIEQEAETRAHLSRFLSPALVEQAQRGQLELRKGGELCEVTVLFADIRGFTSMTEAAQPQEIVALLNEFFERMVDEVFAEGGVLDKFIGDCIMALWGAPVRRPDDPERAVRAGLAMQQQLARYNEERLAQGKAPLAMGVGINTGQAVVGNMGSSKRLEYTAIGDAVNTAARLCDLAKAGQVIASSSTLYKANACFEVVEMPVSKVKGKAQAVHAFQVRGRR